MYIKIDGYQELMVDVDTGSSVTPNRNTNTAEAGFWVTPTVVQHIRVFKMADLVQKDFVVNVNWRGAVVANATVWLEPINALSNVPVRPQIAKTDASGNATFAAASVAFGAQYSVTVLPSAPVNTDGTWSAPSTTSATVTIGTASATAGALVASDPFTLRYDIGTAGASSDSTPRLVTRTPEGSFNATGNLTLVFDRDVKLDSSTLATGGAGLSVAFGPGTKADGTACTAAEIGSPVADTTTPVNVTISGRIVTISPKLSSGALTPVATCGGSTVSYVLDNLVFFATEPNVPAGYSPTATAFTMEVSRRIVTP
jgi:hypothetical protein